MKLQDDLATFAVIVIGLVSAPLMIVALVEWLLKPGRKRCD